MKNLEFKSAICTTKEQSEKLLALGLKKETADIRLRWLYCYRDQDYYQPIPDDFAVPNDDIPAWSLHRLMEIGEMRDLDFSDISKIYDTAVRVIECRTHAGLINPKYLEEK